ncbi:MULTISPECIES: hypothetical protein [Kitasatospora]|uniref:hypothetical protein n=1 Tax=Kitasatospora TaxID=2063 RepID=UPI00030F0556|nr:MULTISPECIES: hypothetical protein [Kitasatospora]
MVECPTRAQLQELTDALTGGTGAVPALPPQLRYAIAGVSAYLAAVEDGTPATGQLRGNAVALWATLRAVAGAARAPDPLPAS